MRPARLGLAAFLAGMVASVLIAWACDYMVGRPSWALKGEGISWTTIEGWPGAVPPDWPPVPTTPWGTNALRRTGTTWSLMVVPSEDPDSGWTYTYAVFAYGFPLPAMRRDRLWISNPTVFMSPGPSREPWTPPLRPALTGLLADSALYGLILLGLFTATGRTRQHLRRRRGLCPRCAYPIGVSPTCTECGAAITTR